MSAGDPLPPSLFRQYIAYAKAHVHPQLSEGAKTVLQDFYLTLRKGAQEHAADTTPITTRQLESLIEEDDRYSNFAQLLLSLEKQFRVTEIESLLIQYLSPPDPHH